MSDKKHNDRIKKRWDKLVWLPDDVVISDAPKTDNKPTTKDDEKTRNETR